MTEFVERPVLGRPRGHSKYPLAAIVETAENGKAVVVALNLVKVSTARASLQHAIKMLGYRAFVHDNKDGTVAVWCKKL